MDLTIFKKNLEADVADKLSPKYMEIRCNTSK